MRRIEVYVSLRLVGCRDSITIEVDDDSDDDAIEEAAREAMFELVEWGWKKPEPTAKSRVR